jgi:hypothetical protein
MKKRGVMVYIVITILVFSFAVISGFSQEDVTTVKDSAFEETMRPSVPFMHDEHNEMAEIEECNTCHHVYEDGEIAEDESSEDMECSECHSSDDDENPMSLVKIYHLRCKGCHQEKKSGPVMCGECHIK